jgi:hypothetical protein
MSCGTLTVFSIISFIHDVGDDYPRWMVAVFLSPSTRHSPRGERFTSSPIQTTSPRRLKAYAHKKGARVGRPFLYKVLEKVSMVTFFVAGMDIAALALVSLAYC